jgi:hypothetical protein
LEKWNGEFPTYFMGTGAEGLNLLLQTPKVDEEKKN